MMMLCLKQIVLSLVMATMAATVAAFTSIPPTKTTSATATSSSLFVAAAPLPTDDDAVTYFDDLVRAVKAVTTFGLCDSDELHTLANKVEAGAETCMFEVPDDKFLCDKEVEDRKDVAEVLRMQAELQLRMDAIRTSSLFAGDVEDELDIRQRDDMLEILGEDAI